MNKVSIIIPVYNAEAFLERCLDSLLAQSHTDWEAICVNDGSRDGSGSILDRYAAEDGRFRVIHKPNEGVSAARNLALETASGKYIAFVDSDDFLHPQCLGICVGLMEENGSDLAAFTYSRPYRTKTMIRHILHIPEGKVRSHTDHISLGFESITTDNVYDYVTEYSKPREGKWSIKHCQPWRCIYRADRIRDIRFIKGIIYEDFPWWGEVLLNIRRASITDLNLYYYYPNKKSYIMSSKQEYRIRSLRVAIDAAEKLYSERGTAEQREVWEKYFLTPFRDKLAKKMRKG